MSTPATPTSPNDPPLRPLSADAFINAMKGETVIDDNGEKVCFYRPHEGLVRITDVKVSGIVDVQFITGFNYDITFESILFTDDLVFSDGQFDHELSIKNCVLESDLIFNGVILLNGINILSGEFKGLLDFQKGQFGSIIIDEGHYYNDFQIMDGKYGLIQIKGGSFGYFFICGGTFSNDIIIHGGRFESFIVQGGDYYNDLTIGGKSAFDFINIHGGVFHKVLRVRTSEIKELWVLGENNQYIEELEFSELVNYRVNIVKTSINKLHLSCTISSISNFSVSRAKLFHVQYLGLINNGQLEFRFCEPLVTASIKRSNHNSRWLDIISSDLGKTTFLNFPFNAFQITMNSSRLAEINTNTTYFPTSKNQQIYSDSNKSINAQTLQENYSQLILAMQKQGNRIQELKYYAEYLEWHRKSKLDQLRKHKSEGKSWWWRVWTADWYTPASLWLHKGSSSYGNNWVRAALIMLGAGLLWYVPYVLCLPGIDVGCAYVNLNDLWISFSLFFGYFWSFLLPTHKVSFIPGLEPGSASLFFDFLGRVSVGFMLYQTIAAFRRFGKR
ncbi:MAG: hypothetical protein RIF33_09030 [Cyclobacteriaceae bacterium]